MPSKRCWRLTPTPAVEYQVEHLARRENRSLANMLNRLLVEALDARRTADTRVDALVKAIRGTAGGESVSAVSLTTQFQKG